MQQFLMNAPNKLSVVEVSLKGAENTSGNEYQIVAQVLLFSAALVAVFCAGGPHQGGMGIFLAAAGGTLLMFPPRRALTWWIWGIACFFILAVSLAMLPEKWLLLPEEWKVLFQGLSSAIPGFTDPVGVSADPPNTIFWIFVLSASILTGLYCLGGSLTPEQLRQMALLVCLGCSLYAVIAIMAWRTGWHYPLFIKDSWAQPIFGFFPNRNHTAGFLLTGAIVALGLMTDAIRSRRIFLAFVASSSFVLLAGSLLFFSISRGGLVFLLLGVMIWLLGLGKQRSGLLISFTGILLSVIVVLFLRSDSGLLDRLRGEGSSIRSSEKSRPKEKSLVDARMSIAQDTVAMIAARPVSGSGLGTYALMYPFSAKRSLRDQTWATHAESDWLTLAAEAGIPATLLALFALGVLCWRIPALALLSGREWPLRWAFLSAFFAELLHGIVDVPLHRPELGWWIMLLVGIGFGGAVMAGENPRLTILAVRFQRGIFVAGGLAMIFLGDSLMLAEWGRGSELPPFATKIVRARLIDLSLQGDKGSLREAIAECQKAICDHPLQHLLYYQLAILVLQEHADIPRAERLFELERRISPHAPSFVFEQGRVLADRDPEGAAGIWREAMRRRLLLDQRPDCMIPRASDLFYSMIAAAQGHPALFAELPALVSSTTPELRMIWYQRPECDPAMIAQAVRDRSFMEQLNSQQQGHLFELWFQHHGERKEIEEFLGQHQEYARVATATRASLLASSGQEKEACRLLVETFHLQIPQITTSIHSAGQDVPDDPLEAARYYLERGNDLAARRLLTESLQAKRDAGDQEGKTLFLRAVLEMRENNWKASVGSLLEFLHTTHQL